MTFKFVRLFSLLFLFNFGNKQLQAVSLKNADREKLVKEAGCVGELINMVCKDAEKQGMQIEERGDWETLGTYLSDTVKLYTNKHIMKSIKY